MVESSLMSGLNRDNRTFVFLFLLFYIFTGLRLLELFLIELQIPGFKLKKNYQS